MLRLLRHVLAPFGKPPAPLNDVSYAQKPDELEALLTTPAFRNSTPEHPVPLDSSRYALRLLATAPQVVRYPAQASLAQLELMARLLDCPLDPAAELEKEGVVAEYFAEGRQPPLNIVLTGGTAWRSNAISQRPDLVIKYFFAAMCDYSSKRTQPMNNEAGSVDANLLELARSFTLDEPSSPWMSVVEKLVPLQRTFACFERARVHH